MADGNAYNMNLSVWETLRGVDRKFTKPITGKSYKGDSPNPTYIIMKLTEVFGPIGQNWGFEIDYDRVREGKPHQIVIEQSQEMGPPGEDGKQPVKSKTVRYQIVREEYHEVAITFWQVVDGERRTFSAIGGTPMLYMAKSGNWMHDEDAAKKSLTDAYTKAASWLGACADIFLGIFDDKYTAPPQAEASGAGPSTQDRSPSVHDRSPAAEDRFGSEDQAKQPDTSRETTAPDGW